MPSSVLHNGVASRCHWSYFLSHKKTHSVHGAVVGQIALGLHDSLDMIGSD